MTRILLQPAAGPASRKHFEDTIRNAPPLAQLRPLLEATDTSRLSEVYGSRPIPTWGIRPGDGDSNRPTWNKLRSGDVVLFTGKDRAYTSGLVTHKTLNRKLAKQLSGTDEAGNTWELMYFLDNIAPVSIPYPDIRRITGYKPKFFPQRSILLSEESSSEMIEEFKLNDGGGASHSPEVEDALKAVEEAAGKRLPEAADKRLGQGFRSSAPARRAIELHAMRLAKKYFAREGWSVDDTSPDHPYDLVCHRTGQELRVEVKGTTSNGLEVLLTPGEVKHSRDQHPNVALFIVRHVQVKERKGQGPRASGGDVRLIIPWQAEETNLKPVGYACAVPEELKTARKPR